ncbi:DinB family protein [Deinococcus irradiatisoli]|uniref:DinB family protein n=1 Tax=Deinococcus irradiatisoli TaxID=2202254 RepID=UPI001FE5EF5E|nr:DinB family protein [Deinococcus irradiatisoli]
MPNDPQYPLGGLPQLTDAERVPATLERFAASMEQAVADWRGLVGALTLSDLARTYRPGSWTVRQLTHHVAEGHLHGLIRLKAGLTTDGYTIQPFQQAQTLLLPDAELPVADALGLLDSLNRRWAALLRGVPATEFAREVVHPQEGHQDL